MNNSDKIILHLCASEYGSDTRDYRAAGYDVRLITKDIGVENYHPPANVYGVIANPPCTMFSRARTTAKTPRDFREGMRLVKRCLEIIWECESQKHLKFWALENPATGRLKDFLGKPAFVYQPWEFGDNMSKETALWGSFNAPQRLVLTSRSRNTQGKSGWWLKLKEKTEKEYGPIKWSYQAESDAKSIASPYFTKAFFEANQ